MSMYYFRDPNERILSIVSGSTPIPLRKPFFSIDHRSGALILPSFRIITSSNPTICTIRKLRDVMFEFVVKNLNWVESFVGLPEMIIEDFFASPFLTQDLKKSCLNLAINASPILDT